MSHICFNNKSVTSKLNPNFPVINSLKTSWSSSNPIMVISPSRKFLRSSCTTIHKTNYYVTRYARTTDKRTPELDTLPKGWFWLRKWHPEDMANICWYTLIHVLAVCAPFMFTWGAFWVAMGLSFLTGFGVTLGYHRLLCHRSFKIPKWLEYFFVYCGAHAFQKDPLFYVNTHKSHHKYADTDRDPVATSHGFWYCNMGWFCNNYHVAAKCGESKGGDYSYVPELKAQWFYRFLRDTYFWHPTALATLLYFHGGLSYLAWGMGMRGVVVHHFAALATYVSHIWGERPWNTPDTSTNNWWVAMLTLGEGWHNNHHAFPRSARHGLEWWQFDPTWELIKFLKFVRLARDVKLPTEADKRRISISCQQEQNKRKSGVE